MSTSKEPHQSLPKEERSPYLTSSRWRHEETSEYHEDEGRKRRLRNAGPQTRNAAVDASETSAPLAEFLNEQVPQIDPAERKPQENPIQPHKPIMVAAAEGDTLKPAESADGKEIVCGPLLNYRRMEGHKWYGSVLCVGKGGGKDIVREEKHVFLAVRRVPLRASASEEESSSNSAQNTSEAQFYSNVLYSDPRNTFWQFDVEVTMDPEQETQWAYAINGLRFCTGTTKPHTNNFFVPAMCESMRILFFSCNGFSVGTDEEAWSGPALWNDVMRQQNSEAPFHVM